MELIKGNLFKNLQKYDVILHGCNCQKNFGAGFAKSIKNIYPAAYAVDCNGTPRLGHFSEWSGKDVTILNLYTQVTYGKPFPHPRNSVKADTAESRYKAISEALMKVNMNFEGRNIVMPKIGCGLAGLSWNRIEKIIENTLTDVNVKVFYL